MADDSDAVKLCSKCGEVRNASSFLSSTKNVCRPCRSEYQKEWYRRNRASVKPKRRLAVKARKDRLHQFVLDHLARHQCVDCGERDPVVLEFDHLVDKESSISEMVCDGRSMESIALEIEKCEVRCANCHRRRTAAERGYYRYSAT